MKEYRLKPSGSRKITNRYVFPSIPKTLKRLFLKTVLTEMKMMRRKACAGNQTTVAVIKRTLVAAHGQGRVVGAIARSDSDTSYLVP